MRVSSTKIVLSVLCACVGLAGLLPAPTAAADTTTPADTTASVAQPRAVLSYQSLRAGATYTNPVYPGDFPDPDVIQVDGTYYAFSTASNYVNIPELTSTDLVHWTQAGDALPQLPAWSTSGRTWAPGVVSASGQWVLFYATLQASSGLQCVSEAVAPTPSGPFADNSSGPLVCAGAQGGSIDPSPFVDQSGQLWLLWKNEGAQGAESIWSSRLTPDGSALAGPASQLITADGVDDGGVVENPALTPVPGGGYDLLFSKNDWSSAGYAVGYASCATPAGPCAVNQGATVLSAAGSALGPGGESVFSSPDGQMWLAYHAWTAPNVGYPQGGARSLRIDHMTFVDGGPMVSGPTTTATFVVEPARLAGPDRYATAAQLAAAAYPNGANTVYLATGAAFPDALAAGPVAAKAGGPILLTAPNYLPAATASELTALHPAHIVILGGTSAVSGAVASQVTRFGATSRLAGADRYATAALLAGMQCGGGAPTVYVATGQNYPDALAGAAAGATQHAPVLLVNGSSVTSFTVWALGFLKPQKIVILGGTAAVSNGVMWTLRRYAPEVVRVAGADRYGTAAQVASTAYTRSVPEAVVATGASFPDALTAAELTKPLVIAPPAGSSTAAQAEMAYLTPADIIVVGGEAAMPDTAIMNLG